MVVLTQLCFTYTLRYSGLCGQRKKAKVACIFFPKCYSKNTGRMSRIEACPPQDRNNSGFTFSAHITVGWRKKSHKQLKAKKWEIKTKWISYGREAEMIELPAYSEYCQYLSDELSKAKRNKDKSRVDEIKSLAQQSEIRLDNHSFPAWLAFFILIICAFVTYWCILKY